MSQFKTANIHSVVDLRTATDEKLGSVLELLGYKQDFGLTDTSLALGYIGAVIAGLTYFLDKKTQFKESLPYLKLLLLLYFLISSAEWVHSKYIRKSIVYKGKKGSETLEISGEIDKHIPIYNLTFTLKAGSKELTTFERELAFNDIFDKFGNLHESQLKSWIEAQFESHSSKKAN